MKKTLFVIAIAIINLLTINGQEKGDIEIGGGLGINFSIVRADNNNSTDVNIGFNIAASGEYYFSDRWGIKTKLIYDQKGWGNGYFMITDENGNSDNITTDFNVNYLTIPVTANWHFGKTRKWYLNIGAFAGFLLSAKTKEGGLDVKEVFERTGFGITAGIGYKFPINEQTKLYIEYDEQYGLTNMFKVSDGSSAYNSRSSFNVGVLFSL